MQTPTLPLMVKPFVAQAVSPRRSRHNTDPAVEIKAPGLLSEIRVLYARPPKASQPT